MSTDSVALYGSADGPRPAQRLGFRPDELDGPRLRIGDGVRRQHLDLGPERDSVEEERS
jgi:hypothetical protein